jgi:endonuclease III
MKLVSVVAVLRKHYGKPAPPLTRDPFELVLLENAAYLVDDARRRATWDALRDGVGFAPARIAAIPVARLARVLRGGGILPEHRAKKVQKAARVAVDRFGGRVKSVLSLPVSEAKRALQRFPSIGEPGADKILMLTRTAPVLALDSNALRVLVRLGFEREHKRYAATYRAMQTAIARDVKKDYRWLTEASDLLRLHGQTLCKRTKPRCDACPLSKECPASSSQCEERTLGPGSLLRLLRTREP